MNKYLLVAEQIVGKKFDKDYEHYGLLVLSCYALLTKFKDYQEIIENIFNNCKFHLDSKALDKILKDNKISIKRINHTVKDLEKASGLAINGKSLLLKKRKLFKNNNNDSNNLKIVCTTNNGVNETLNTIVHELAHLVKSSVNNHFFDNYGNEIIRSGMNLIIIEKNTRKVLNTNSVLEEAINTLQTTEMLQEINKLDKKDMSNEVKQTFDKLNLEKLKNISGYETEAALLLMIWNNKRFKEIIEDNIVIGNIEKIENDFNNVLENQEAFQKFSEAFDIINSRNEVDQVMINRTEYIINISRLYELKNMNNKNYKKK